MRIASTHLVQLGLGSSMALRFYRASYQGSNADDTKYIASRILEKFQKHTVKSIAPKAIDATQSSASTLRGISVFKNRGGCTDDYVYPNQRELESFARCVAIQESCTAVMKHFDIFEVSFNHDKGRYYPETLLRQKNPVKQEVFATKEGARIDSYLGTFLDLYKLGKTHDLFVHVLQYSRGYDILKDIPIPQSKEIKDGGELHTVTSQAQRALSGFHSLLADTKLHNTIPNAQILEKYHLLLKTLHKAKKLALVSDLLMPLQDVKNYCI